MGFPKLRGHDMGILLLGVYIRGPLFFVNPPTYRHAFAGTYGVHDVDSTIIVMIRLSVYRFLEKARACSKSLEHGFSMTAN